MMFSLEKPPNIFLGDHPQRERHIFHAQGHVAALFMLVRTLELSSRTAAPLFNGRKVSFYNVAGVGLIEILE